MVLDTCLVRDATLNPRMRPDALKAIRRFLNAGGDPNAPVLWEEGVTAGMSMLLPSAAAGGWNEAVRVLIDAGADAQIEEGSPLRLAASNNHLTTVDMLLSAGADVQIGDGWALHLAAGYGHLPIVERLLAAGADVHTRDDLALRWAASESHLPVVERLLAAGADVHAHRDEALRWAVASNDGKTTTRAVIERLLAAGADVHAGAGQPVRWAMENADHRTFEQLLRHGADAASAWHQMNRRGQAAAAPLVNAMAAAIPAAQRAALLAIAPHRFPALHALQTTARRRRPGRGGHAAKT